MNANEVKGYLSVKTQAAFLKGDRIEIEDLLDPVPDVSPSFAGQGWHEITHLIPEGEFIKISARSDQRSVEAKFNILKNTPHGNNGIYEIKGGLFEGAGTFVNVSKRDRTDVSFQAKNNANYEHFFICHSTKNGCGSILRWCIVLQEFEIGMPPID